MSDLIDRQAAIDALMEIMDRPNHADFLYTDEICKTLNELPSAQPNLQPTCNELAKDTNVPCKDTISRQAAIDGLDVHYIERINLNDWQTGWNAALDWMKDVYLDEFPSAQPEPIKITIDHAPTPDELERLKQAMRNTPVMLLPSAQPESEHTMEEFMYGQDLGSPEDGSL